MSDGLNLEPEIALVLDSFARELSKLETDRIEERDKRKLKCEKYIKDVEANLQDYEKEIGAMDLECRSEHTTYLEGLRQRFKDLIDSYNKIITESASPKQRQNGGTKSSSIKPFDVTMSDGVSTNGSRIHTEEMVPHETDGVSGSLLNRTGAYFYACFCVGRRATFCKLFLLFILGVMAGYVFMKLFVMAPTSTKKMTI